MIEFSDLPEGWTWATPEELKSEDRHALAIGPFGSNLKVSDYTKQGVPLVFVRNIRSGYFVGPDTHYVSKEKARELAAHTVTAGDVLITKMGDPPGDAIVYPMGSPDAIITADCIRFQVNSNEVLPKYVQHYVNSGDGKQQFKRMTRGVAQKKVSLARFKELRIPVPPMDEQKEIVAVIETQFARLDDAVAALQRSRTRLKRYRASVLKAACEGRLVPTEAELARQEGRSYEPASVLLERIQAEREAAPGKKRGKAKNTASVDTSQLPELPEGWVWTTLDQITSVQGGIQKQPKRAPKDNAFPFLRVANVLRGRLDLTEIHQIELFGDELEKLRLKPGDLLIVEGNGSPDQIGRMAIWNGAVADCVHQNHIIRARAEQAALPTYIEAFWNSPTGMHLVRSVAASTSGLYTLSVSKVSKIPVPAPPLAEQERIVEEVERRLSVIDQMGATVETNLKRAESLRQSILRMAFSGRLVTTEAKLSQ